MSFDQQLEIVKNREGFIAALDQSGGSTPKALRLMALENRNIPERIKCTTVFTRCGQG